MTYAQALDYIDSFKSQGSKPGLERVAELLAKLGNPQERLRIIHVAGTNGKGSFCAMLESVLSHAGYRVGAFTSPVLERLNETFRRNGRDIPDEDLAGVTESIRPYVQSMTDLPTEFELYTAMAFVWFARERCDYVILECGLGGRQDATNVINRSLLSVITGISLDHTRFLGSTIEDIAAEKAGILKENTPCLWCGNQRAADDVIRSKAEQMHAELYRVDRSTIRIGSAGIDGTLFDFGGYRNLKISLLGLYQVQNAANVICAVEILRRLGAAISDQALYAGLASAKWKARFELMSRNPVVIYDGGHNPEGVDSAVESVKAYFGDEKLCVVTGVMADKNYAYIARSIAQIASHVYCLTPNQSRSLAAEQYAETFRSLGTAADAYPTIPGAVHAALKQCKEQSAPLLCIGSLYMYADVKKALRADSGSLH